MSLPFDLATSICFNNYHISESKMTPVERIDVLPPTAKLWKGSIYTVPGLSTPGGFKFCQYANDLICMVNRGLAGFDAKEFEMAVARIRQSISYEWNRVDTTYKHRPFKRLVGLSQLHAYRANKHHVSSYVRKQIGLNEDETISFLSPTTAAATVKGKKLNKSLAELPIPIAVVRNHHIDGHIYLSLGEHGMGGSRIPVALVSSINEQTLESINDEVSRRRAHLDDTRAFWTERLNTINVVMSIIERGEYNE